MRGLSDITRRAGAECKGPASGMETTKMDLNIAGLRVMVTAGAAGIGLQSARTFYREGARVHVCDVDRAALQEATATDDRCSAWER